jgi:HEAT repeat protein
MIRASMLTLLLALGAVSGRPHQVDAQEPRPGTITAEEIRAAINQLGVLEYPVRMKAAQTIRRAHASVATATLTDAVSSHADGYVRFRSLVLLAGFNDPRTKSLMLQALKDPNDRLRATAYAYFEHYPAAEALAIMIPAYQKEQSEFVRPALSRALAAASVAGLNRTAGETSQVLALQQTMRQAVTRGQDFFRSVVIEALGDYKAGYALEEISGVASIEGPLQDDAVLALGRIGDKHALRILPGIQRFAPRDMQPTIAAAFCLLGVNCLSHVDYLIETLRFSEKNPGFQGLLRSAAAGLAAVAATGHGEAMAALFTVGVPSRDPARAPIALAVGTVAIRNPAFLLRWLEEQTDVAGPAGLLAEAFDMLEEDFLEERFFATVRRAYWTAAEGSVTRSVGGTLIGKLQF